MGNIHAAGPATPPPPPAPTPHTVTPVDEPKKGEEKEGGIENPGTMEDIHKQCKGKAFLILFCHLLGFWSCLRRGDCSAKGAQEYRIPVSGSREGK